MIAPVLAFALTALPAGAFVNATARAIAQAASPASQDDAPASASSEVIAEVRLQGNVLTTDQDLLALAGLRVGDPFTPSTIADTEARLRRAGHFRSVRVLERFASIADPSRIVVVVIVDEGPVRLETPKDGGPPRVVRRRGLTNLLFLPILDSEDNYGLSYGVRFAYVGVSGRRGRLSFPLTLGGTKRAAAEFERTFETGPLTFVGTGAAIEQRHNPAFDENDRRERWWVRGERALKVVRVGGSAGWQRVTFAQARDDLRTIGGDVTIDTRTDPAFGRNAVYTRVSAERVAFVSDLPTVVRTKIDARGYLGLMGPSVVAARILIDRGNRPEPPYLQPLLGGSANLRGFRPGSFVGDSIAAGAIELRVPLSRVTLPVRTGLSVFVDRGVAYARGERFYDGPAHTGVGGSVWLTFTGVRLGLSVAHGLGATTRVEFGTGLTF